MTVVRIKSATVEDADTLTELNREFHDLHAQAVPRNFKFHRPGPVREAIAQLLAKENVRALIAEVDGTDGISEPAGYALFLLQRRPEDAFCHERRWVYVDHIAVRAEYRGRGVGRRLIEAVKEHAKQLGVEEIELEAWKFNAQARGFFHSGRF